MTLRFIINDSETYKQVIEHRTKCKKWPQPILTKDKEMIILDGKFCLECFGGGLTKFSENLIRELNFVIKEDIEEK